MSETSEKIRLEEAREQKVLWKKWGPYLAERYLGAGKAAGFVKGAPETGKATS